MWKLYVLINNAVQCPVGTYFSLEHNECASCWIGSFQDREGQLECNSCPEGTSTAYLHARSLSECKGKITQSELLFSLCMNTIARTLLLLHFQGSVSLAVTLWMDWRSASLAHWATTSLVLVPGSVWSVLTRPPQSPEEQWMRQNVEVTQSDSSLSCQHSHCNFMV